MRQVDVVGVLEAIAGVSCRASNVARSPVDALACPNAYAKPINASSLKRRPTKLTARGTRSSVDEVAAGVHRDCQVDRERAGDESDDRAVPSGSPFQLSDAR